MMKLHHVLPLISSLPIFLPIRLLNLLQKWFNSFKKDGSLVLSGILEEQHDFVLGAYVKQGLKHLETSYHQGWVTIHLK